MGIVDIAKRTAWFRADDISGSNGSSIGVWRSYEGIHAPKSNTAPTLATAATPAGGKSVRFANGGGFYLGRAAAPTGIVAVTASESFTGLRPDTLFSGATLGAWSTDTATTATITVQYASAVTATAVKLYARATFANQAPKDFTVQASNDGSSWSTLHTVTGAAPSSSGTTYSFTNSTGYTYWRLSVTAVQSGGSAVGLARMDFTGAPTVALTGSSSGEVWVVVKSDGTVTQNSSWGKFGASGQQSHYPYDGVVYDDFGHATRRSFTPSMSITSTYRILRFSLSSAGAWLASLDGTSQATASSVTASWPTNVFIGSGSEVASSPPTIGLTGWIAALVVFNDALDSTEAATVLSELTATYISAPTTVTGTVAGTSPTTSGAVTGTVPTTGTVAGASPSGVGALTGTAPTTGTVAGVSPVGAGSLTGTAPTTGTVAGTSPAGVGAFDGTSDTSTGGTIAGVSPSGVGSLDGVVPTAGAVAGVSPTGVGALTGDVVTPESEIMGTSPAGAGSISGTVGDPTAERTVQCVTYRPVSVIPVVPLVPVTPLADAVPITRVSVLAPNLSAEHPMHPEQGAPGAPEVIEEIIGYPQLFIGGQNVTNLRGVQTVIRKWASEAPFGDTAAAFEFPQKNPWDEDGVGDLDFLTRDARVAIGIREETDPGVFRVRRLWSGFLDARGSGLGEAEDYFYEAKGAFWQAASQLREPHPLPASQTVDIGVWIARVMNAVEGRRWATMPLTPIGIPTRTRGSRGQYVMEYVQELLSEAITDDFRQWSLVEVAPGVPRLVLKPAPSEVHATVAYGTPGVDIGLRLDWSTVIDRLFMSGIGKNGGGWANVTYPWLYKIDDAPDYPLDDPDDNITLGMTDGDTVSGSGVTDFQRRVDELDGFANPAVSGVMSAAWMAVVDDLQRRLGLTPGPLDAATWERVFDGRPNLEGLKPKRLPMASKPEAEKYLYTADGKRLPGTNPAWDGRVPRDWDIHAGVGRSKADGFKLARKILEIFGEPAHNGSITWVTDPRETDRTRLSHLSNIKVTGYQGRDVVVQVASKEVSLDDGGADGPVYVVTTSVDERARDASVVDDLIEQRRDAKGDPSRRAFALNRASRNVSDQRTPWDIESPCGKLRRTAVPSGWWRIRHIPFAEVGKLASISIDSTMPFAFAIFASLRITESKLNAKGSPFESDDFWRDNKPYFDSYGIIEAWGEKDNACGYSPKSEADGGAFTGEFRLDTPVDYWTETPPVVAVAFYMRGGSGWVQGGTDVDGVRRGFIPAYEA